MNCTKNNPIQARLFMLGAAVATATDYRPCLRHIYCDGENIVSTNGKWLVYTRNDEKLAKGFYDLCTTGSGRDRTAKFVPVTDEKAKDWHYPDWKRVVPNCTGGKKLEFLGTAEIRELETFKLQFTLAAMGTGALIGQEYIDLLSKPQLRYEVRIIDGLLPVIFEVPNFYTVVVMPRRASEGKSEVKKLLDEYNADVIAEWKRTRDAGDGRPRLTPEEKAALNGTAPEPPVAAEPESTAGEDAPQDAPEAQDAPEPPVAAPQEQEPESAGEDVPGTVPEPVTVPETAQDAPKAPKAAAKPRRSRKPAFAYYCELKDGTKLTLDSIEAVRERGDVVKCRIEPVKRSRKAA